MSSQKISPALFVQLYMESHKAGHTTAEFAERIGMPYRAAYTRARYYKRKGVRLPALRRSEKFAPGRRQLDVDGLNSLLASGARSNGRLQRA